MIVIFNKTGSINDTVRHKDDSPIHLSSDEDFTHYSNHWHGVLEIIMSLDNQYQISCDNKDFILREGDILLIPPGMVHCMKPSLGKCMIFQADTILLNSIKEIEANLSRISPVVLINPEDSPVIHGLIHNLMLEISEEYLSHAPMSEASIYSKLIEILVLVGRNFSADTNSLQKCHSKQSEYTTRFLYICEYINLHYTENITLDFVANMSGYSKYHFSRLFKQFTSISFYKYLNKKKIDHAESLLLDNELTITEVSLRCGFSSLSAFLRMFKIMKGCTPTEFKSTHST